MKLTAEISIGADPELFMKHPDTGAFLSAHDRIPGTKYEPFRVPYGAVQVDGTALEFNIDPARTVGEFVHNITHVIKTMKEMVPGYNVVAEPVAYFASDYWKDVPASAQALGCDPDYNGWTGKQNPQPDPAGKPMRTAAGHIHIGWCEDADIYDKEHFILACRIARQMDYYLGIYSLVWDKDATRRQLYGKAGAMRVKPYGVEYRVLSNRWLQSEELTKWVFNSAKKGVEEALEHDNWAEAEHGDLARHIIDNNVTDWIGRSTINLPVAGVPGPGL
jgi:hypothetical protein